MGLNGLRRGRLVATAGPDPVRHRGRRGGHAGEPVAGLGDGGVLS